MQVSDPSAGPPAHNGLQGTSRELESTQPKDAEQRRPQRVVQDPTGDQLSASLNASDPSPSTRDLDSAGRNLAGGISLTRSADGQAQAVGQLLVRMRELAIQSGGEGLSKSDREAVQGQFNGLREAVDQLSARSFKGQRGLFEGSDLKLSIRVNHASGERLEIEMPELSVSELDLHSNDLSSAGGAAASRAKLELALDSVTEYRGELGAAGAQLSERLAQVTKSKLALSNSPESFRDVELALEAALVAQRELLLEGSASVRLQSNVAATRAQSLLGGYL